MTRKLRTVAYFIITRAQNSKTKIVFLYECCRSAGSGNMVRYSSAPVPHAPDTIDCELPPPWAVRASRRMHAYFADMKADVLAAVIAGGDLTVNGTLQAANSGHSSFQGLLYSKGDLTLSNTRTVGTVVSASDATGQPGKLVIQDSQVISTPDTSDFRLVIKAFGPQQQGGLGAQTQQHQGSGNGWELLEPNPADLLSQDAGGKPVFVWDDSHLKIRIQQPDGSWRVISTPEEAAANGLDPAGGELASLTSAYNYLKNTVWPSRVQKLNEEYKKELVDVIHFDLNEFLKVSSRLKAKKVYFKD